MTKEQLEQPIMPGAIQLVEDSLSQKDLYNLIVIADRNKHSDIANFALKLLNRAFDPLFIVTKKKKKGNTASQLTLPCMQLVSKQQERLGRTFANTGTY